MYLQIPGMYGQIPGYVPTDSGLSTYRFRLFTYKIYFVGF